MKPYLAEFKHPSPESKVTYPFRNGETVLVIGEIENMPGHLVVLRKDSHIEWGYHAEHFRKLDVSET
jgi:hypothetical protein